MLRRYFRICPAMFILMAYIFSSIGTVYAIGTCWKFTLCAIPLAIAFILWGCRKLTLTLAVVLSGLLWAELHEKAPWHSYLKYLPREECSIAAYVKVVDEPECRLDALCATLHITQICTPCGWRSCNGKLMGFFMKEETIAYGDILKINGAVLKFEDSDMFGFYRKIHGIKRKCVVHDVMLVAHRPSAIVSCLFKLKRRMADLLVKDFKDNECAGLYLAMILGIRDGMPNWSREVFVRSSSVHLFSISGLHILFFSRFIEWILGMLAIPRKYHVWTLLPTMLVYVCISGGAPSALRSYYMVLAMIIAFVRKRQHSMENGLALSGLALLIYNPQYMMHMGFLFSFILVYCLLRGRGPVLKAYEVLSEKSRLIPSGHGVVAVRMFLKSLFSLVAGGVLAWFGSVGIMMRTSCFIAFGAVMVNILLAPLASILVFLAIPKVIAAMSCPGLSAILAGCIECLMKTLVLASKSGGSGMLCLGVARIGLPTLLAYYAFLAIALSGIRPFAARVCALLALCCIIVATICGRQDFPCLVVTTSAGGNPPCLSVVEANQAATIIQLGDIQASRRMHDALRRMGCADRIYIRVQSKQDARSATAFPSDSIKAIMIDGHAYEAIVKSKNYISKNIDKGTHLLQPTSHRLNGLEIQKEGKDLDVILPQGELKISNSEEGVTTAMTPDGRRREFHQHLGARCEIISLRQ